MTPPKPVDLDYIKMLLETETRTFDHAEYISYQLNEQIPGLVIELEYLRSEIRKFNERIREFENKSKAAMQRMLVDEVASRCPMLPGDQLKTDIQYLFEVNQKLHARVKELEDEKQKTKIN